MSELDDKLTKIVEDIHVAFDKASSVIEALSYLKKYLKDFSSLVDKLPNQMTETYRVKYLDVLDESVAFIQSQLERIGLQYNHERIERMLDKSLLHGSIAERAEQIRLIGRDEEEIKLTYNEYRTQQAFLDLQLVKLYRDTKDLPLMTMIDKYQQLFQAVYTSPQYSKIKADDQLIESMVQKVISRIEKKLDDAGIPYHAKDVECVFSNLSKKHKASLKDFSRIDRLKLAIFKASPDDVSPAPSLSRSPANK